MGGSFVTTQQRLLEFRFPEFHHHKTIEWTCHVDTKTDPKEAQYDMIVGMDLMNELGIEQYFVFETENHMGRSNTPNAPTKNPDFQKATEILL